MLTKTIDLIRTYLGNNPLANYLAIKRSPLDFISRVLRNCGDSARVQVFMFRFYLINDADLIREALVEKHTSLIIKGGVSSGLARLIGRGILTNHGKQWRESRRTLQPLFNQDAIQSYLSVFKQRITESLERWKSDFSDGPVCLNRELLSLSCRIACSTLFNYLPTFAEAEEFADAVWILQLDGMKRYMDGGDFLFWLPTIRNRRVNCARDNLIGLADRAIEMGTQQSRNEILSILFAGTESPANTLCWVLYLLEKNPRWYKKLITFIDELSPTGIDSCLEEFDVLSQVMSEAIRLYPAGWAFERYAREDVTLGGERIKKGSRLLFSPYFLHRNPRYWKDPEVFDPLRFSQSSLSADGVPKYAYLPFGAGPRSCIGSRLAWIEMKMTLIMILKKTRLKFQTPIEKFEAEGSFKIRLNQPLYAHFEFKS